MNTTCQPMHVQFVVPSKRNANIIVPEGLNSVALDLVVSKLKIVLDQRECKLLGEGQIGKAVEGVSKNDFKNI